MKCTNFGHENYLTICKILNSPYEASQLEPLFIPFDLVRCCYIYLKSKSKPSNRVKQPTKNNCNHIWIYLKHLRLSVVVWTEP